MIDLVQVCAERVATRTSMVRERSERCKDAQTSLSKRRDVPRRKASAEQRMRAMTARFLSVAKGNISRLRDAQAFHAAVKRPPYFMFARQRRHFTAGHSLPGLSGPYFGLGSMTGGEA